MKNEKLENALAIGGLTAIGISIWILAGFGWALLAMGIVACVVAVSDDDGTEQTKAEPQ